MKRWSGSAVVLRWMGNGPEGHEPSPQFVVALEDTSLSEGKDVS